MSSEKVETKVFEIDESDIDEYEEVQEAVERYDKNIARLIDSIAERDEMVEFLKIAPPAKIAEGRQCIAQWNSLIESIEDALQDNILLIEQSRNLVRTFKQIEAFNNAVEPALLKYAEEHPEKRELIEAILTDDGKSH